MNIAFCVNRLALIGLGPTVSSLVRNCSDSAKLTLYFLGADLKEKDKENIFHLLKKEKFKGKHSCIDFNPKAAFGEFPSIHGDWTAYGRLLLPEIIPEDLILYLDSDLIIELDILDFEQFKINGFAVGAINGDPITWATEGQLMVKEMGLSPETEYFNSGVLLMDLHTWRSEKIKEKCFEIGRKYPTVLISHDQTMLNALFGNHYSKIPNKYNSIWMAFNPKPKDADKMILHFMGSPKPWDIGGKIMHPGYQTWIKYLDKHWEKSYFHISLKDLKRTWKIRRSYIRVILSKIKG